MRDWISVLLFCCGLTVGVGAVVEKAEDAPRPLSPEESVRRMVLPEGLRIELVASEPVVEEPSGVAWDEWGRMFVCELHGYNVEGHLDTEALNQTGELDTTVRRVRWEFMDGEIAQEAAKRQSGVVKLLEDSDGDGVMDEAVVWADDLPPCYGIVAANGGIIVACAPHVMFFADRDGDGVPEVRETLFTGFEVETLERAINNPRWGLDGWIYVGSGGGGGRITGPYLDGEVRLGSSDFRMRADGSAIEPVNGSVGTFGMTMNAIGDRFPSSGGSAVNYALPLPYRYLARNPHVATPRGTHGASNYNRGLRISEPHPWRVQRRKDPEWIKFYGERETDSNYFSGGCSTTFYGGGLLPEAYWGSFFYCEPSLNLIHRPVVTRDGAGYRARRADEEAEFLASTDQWFRPMSLRTGPDGALYVVDMYREIIEDYSAIPRFLQQQYGLDQGKGHGRIWRLLPEGGKAGAWADFSAMPAGDLVAMLDDDNPWKRETAQRLLVERGVENVGGQAGVRALYVLDELGMLDADAVRQALGDEAYGVRLHGLRLAGRWIDTDAALRAKVFSMVGDADASVRLQVAMTLGECSDAGAAEALLAMARMCGEERWMDAAILSSVNGVQGGRVLVGMLAGEELAAGERAVLKRLVATVAARGDGEALREALGFVGGHEVAVQREVLEGAVNVDAGDGDWSVVLGLVGSEDGEVRRLAVELAGKLSLVGGGEFVRVFGAAAERALDEGRGVEERLRAVRMLALARFETLEGVATKLLVPRQPPVVHAAVVAALGASDDVRVGGFFVGAWPGLSPAIRRQVLGTVFGRQNRLVALVEALEQGVVQRGDLSDVQREQLESVADARLAARAKAVFSGGDDGGDLAERVAVYRRALGGKRDVAAGRLVYEQNCVVCHKLGELGNEVGPSLASSSGKPDEAILLDVLDPHGKVEAEYKLYLLTGEGGETYAGVLASESATSVTLKGADGSTVDVLRKGIASMEASDFSLMPGDFHLRISPGEMADLIGYMRGVFEVEAK